MKRKCDGCNVTTYDDKKDFNCVKCGFCNNESNHTQEIGRRK